MNVQVCAFAGLCICPVWPDLYECTTGQQNVHVQGLSQVCKDSIRVLSHQNVSDLYPLLKVPSFAQATL